MAKIVLKDESYRIIGACFEVYNQMGCGFLEAVYQQSLEHELRDQGIPFTVHKQLQLVYKHHKLDATYVPDVICFDKIIVEIKAVKELSDQHRAQVHNYLKATNFKLGILVNFGRHPKLQSERIVR